MNKGRFKPYTSIDPLVDELLRDPEVRMFYEDRKTKEKLAATIKKLREIKHLTQSELAKKAGTTQVVIARLESGRDARTTSMPLLSRIAAACGRHFEIAFPPQKHA